MQVSLRAHLSAGLAAALGAGVLTVVPAAHVPALPVSQGVVLAALHNPIEELIGTGQMIQTYLTASYYNGANAPTPGAGEANWPFAGMDQTGGDTLNFLLANQKTLGDFSHVGLFGDIISINQPIVDQFGINWLGYLNNVLTGVTGAGAAAAAGVWNFPGAVVDAVKLVFNGQAQQAFNVLVDAVITPITTATTSLIGGVAKVAQSIVDNLVAVAKVIPTNLQLFGGWLFGGGAYLVNKAVATTSQWFQELGQGNLEAAWNTAVDGLLGPSGLPGAAFNLSLGAGIQTGPIVNPQTDLKGNYLPSLRTAIQGTLWNTQQAMTTGTASSAAATPVRAAAAVAPVVEPVDSVAKVDLGGSSAAGNDANTGTPAVSRRGERAAAASGDSTDAPAAKSRRGVRSAGN